MKNDFNILLTIISGSMIMIGLVLFIVLFAVLYKRRMQRREMEHVMAIKNKELEVLNAAIRTQETEREKFARDLHDEIGPLMSSIKMNITKNQMVLKKGNLTVEDLQEGRKMIDTALESVRNIAHGLSPRFVKEFGLVSALEEFIRKSDDPKLQFESELEEGQRFSQQLELNLYRIALELLQNIRKHEQFTYLRIVLLQQQNKVQLHFEHDGEGISNEEFQELLKTSKGIGLESLISRVNTIEGVLSYQKGSPASIDVMVTLLNEGNE